MAIPQQFIDDLVSRCDVVEVVSAYVPLTRKGGNLWGLCPFHNEKTPSFSVSPDKQIYHCFGCGKGGGAISFVMELENLTYPDAIRHLAKTQGMEVPEEQFSPDVRKKRARLLELNTAAARYYHKTLISPTGTVGAAYFARRGLSRNVIRQFGLGMAPDGWDKLLLAMAELGYDKHELVDAGLAVRGDKGRIYDRFRNRVMFPIINVRSEVIGFGGRVLGDETPKYLNSNDTLIYNKSRNLFGLNVAKNSKAGRIILTEGYMDTIALHQAGFDCAVASLGTAFTDDHAKLLTRYTNEVILSFDGDEAGQKAANRTIPILEKAGLAVNVLQMKGAKDPDEFIKTFGAEAFGKLLDKSENHIEFRLNQIAAAYHLGDDENRISYLQEAAAYVATLSSPIEREIYGVRVAETAHVTSKAMADEVERIRRKKAKDEKRKEERQSLTPLRNRQPQERSLRYDDVPSALAEEGVLRLVLLDPDRFFPMAQALWPAGSFSAAVLEKAFALLRGLWDGGNVVSLSALPISEEGFGLTMEELNHITGLVQKPENLAQGEQAMRDYLSIIARRKRPDEAQDPLLAAMEKYGKN